MGGSSSTQTSSTPAEIYFTNSAAVKAPAFSGYHGHSLQLLHNLYLLHTLQKEVIIEKV